MKLTKTTVALIMTGLLSGIPAVYAHDRDDGDWHRATPRQEWNDRHDYGYRHEVDNYRWREYRRHERWEHEHHRGYGYGDGYGDNHYRSWDDHGQRVVIGLPLPPLVLPPPPTIVLKKVPGPVVLLPRP